MIKTSGTKILAIILATFLLQTLANKAFAADYASTDEVVKEIEKTLLFDKDSREKIDVYKKKKITKKSDFTMSAGEEKDAESTSEIDIVVVDYKAENFDLREKEKLAYNAAIVGQYEVAIELYKQVIAVEPNNVYSKFSLAVVYQKLGQTRQAKTLYRDLLKNNPDNQEEIVGNLLAILIEESPKDASYLLSRLSAQNPDSSYILAQAAIAYDKTKNYPQAISLLERVVAMEPSNVTYKYNLAVIYDKTDQDDKAVNLYSDVVENYSSNTTIASLEQIEKRIQSLKNKI